MKIDLNHYGLIGFQKEWRTLQREGGNNLLERFVDDCIVSGVDGCAVTSEEELIPRGSCHDRFGILRKIANGESTGLSYHNDKLNSEYKVNLLGDNYMQIEKDRKLIHLVNSQAVRLSEESEKIKILIIGDNRCKDQKSLSESLDYLKEPRFTIIPKKLSQHKRPENIENARRALLKYLDLYDAVVGYDAQ